MDFREGVRVEFEEWVEMVIEHYGKSHPEPVFLNVYGAPESIPRNEFRQPI